MSKIDTLKCDGCKHNEVCRYKDEFEALVKKINEIFYEKAEPSPFDVEATCKHFSKPELTYWAEGVKELKTFETWENPCDICPSNPKYSPFGIQVGDTPCTFCRYRTPTVISGTSADISTTTSKDFNNIKLTGTAKEM